jgi:NAD-dependent SIR2 family protein deacetylase
VVHPGLRQDERVFRDLDVAATALAALMSAGGVVLLTGAGISTESGIPDYRGPTGVARRHTPMTFQAFTRDATARRRYWARSHLGWRFITHADCNDGHHAVAELERRGLVLGTITQNVDGLHTRAGSHRVVDLHGRLDRVVCLGCGQITDREALHARLTAANASWDASATAWNPDGDVELDELAVGSFVVVDCGLCGGLLKPDVVYFGESVPRDRVAESYALVDDATSLVVLGSSLTVYSGRRFVQCAAQRGIPIAIVNAGPTRCDDLATLRLDVPLGRTLQGTVDRLARAA